MYKTAFPEKELFTVFENFLQLDSFDQKNWVAPRNLDEKSLMVIDGLVHAQFFYEKIVGGNPSKTGAGMLSIANPSEIVRKIPEVFRFSYQLQNMKSHQIISFNPFFSSLEGKIDRAIPNSVNTEHKQKK